MITVLSFIAIIWLFGAYEQDIVNSTTFYILTFINLLIFYKSSKKYRVYKGGTR